MNTLISDEVKHKKPMNEKMMKGECAADDSDDDELECGGGEDDKRKRVASGATSRRGGGGEASTKSCQAEKCTVDLSGAKAYHRRHKVCEHHAKAQVVVVAGIRQRFCQQCSRFHELFEFDEAKRSCRRRLAGHNERRRKNPAAVETKGGGSGSSSGHPIPLRTNSMCDDI